MNFAALRIFYGAWNLISFCNIKNMCNKIFNCLFVLKINSNWINSFHLSPFSLCFILWIARRKCFLNNLSNSLLLLFSREKERSSEIFLSIFYRNKILIWPYKKQKNRKVFYPMTIVCATTFMWHFYFHLGKRHVWSLHLIGTLVTKRGRRNWVWKKEIQWII